MSKRRPNARRGFESLEDRRMMASTQISNGDLYIYGNDGPSDTVQVSQRGNNYAVTINGSTQNVPMSSLRNGCIYFRGYRGDDTFTNYTSLRSIGWGGEGRDTFYGSSNVDKFYGGNGTDFLYGYGGNDELWGEGGDDRLYGGSNNDDLIGGSGQDTLYGEMGADRMWGEGGVDYLAAGDDRDSDYLDGGADRDTYAQVRSNDRVYDPPHLRGFSAGASTASSGALGSVQSLDLVFQDLGAPTPMLASRAEALPAAASVSLSSQGSMPAKTWASSVDSVFSRISTDPRT